MAKTDRSNVLAIIHLAISFVFIFMSFFVAQTFQTSSDHPQDGAIAVGIVYFVFCLSNFFLSSFLTKVFGVKLTLILSSLTYGFFIGSNIYFNRWILFISSFLVGLGAALLWTAQGVYVTVSTTNHEQINHLPSSSTRGFLNGIFFGIFALSLAIGNLIAAYLFRLQLAQWMIFTIMTAIAAIGTILMIFLRPVQIPVEENEKTRSPLDSLTIFIDKPFLFLIPACCYSGLAQGFIFGSVPPLIIDKSLKFLIFAFLGMVNTISSFLFGKLSDHLHRRLIIFAIAVVAQVIIFVFFLTSWKPPLDQTRFDIFIIMSIGLSMGDAIFMTQLYPILAIFYGKTRPADAFAAFKAFQAGATAVGFLQQIFFSFRIQVISLIALALITFGFLVYGNYRIKSLDTEIETNEEKVEAELQIPLKTNSNEIL